MLRAELAVVVSLGLIVSVFGHGRLIDPASRNAAGGTVLTTRCTSQTTS